MTAEQKRVLSRRQFLRSGAFAAGTVVLAACTPPQPAAPAPAAQQPAAEEKAPAAAASAKVTEIVFMNTASSDSSEQLYKPIYEKFQAVHPEIKVKFLGVVPEGGWGAYFDKVAVLIAGGQTVDIGKIPTEGGRLAAVRGLTVPLDDYIANWKDKDEYFNDISAELSKVFVFGGKTYGLPYDYNNMMVWFNTKSLQEAGLSVPKEDWTFDDLVTYAQKLTKREGDQTTSWGMQFWLGPFGLCPWLFNNGLDGIMTGDMLEKPEVTNPKFVEVTQYLYDLIYKHKVAPRLDAELSANFENGSIAMTIAGRWPIAGYMEHKFEDYEVQYWPMKTRRVTEVGCGSWPIFANSQHKEEAWTWETWLLSKDSSTYMVSQGANIPSRRSVGVSADFVKLPKNSGKLWYESIDRKDIPVMSVTAPPDFSEMEGILNRHLTKIMANEAQIEPELQACQKELDEMVAKRPPEWAKGF